MQPALLGVFLLLAILLVEPTPASRSLIFPSDSCCGAYEAPDAPVAPRLERMVEDFVLLDKLAELILGPVC